MERFMNGIDGLVQDCSNSIANAFFCRFAQSHPCIDFYLCRCVISYNTMPIDWFTFKTNFDEYIFYKYPFILI